MFNSAVKHWAGLVSRQDLIFLTLCFPTQRYRHKVFVQVEGAPVWCSKIYIWTPCLGSARRFGYTPSRTTTARPPNWSCWRMWATGIPPQHLQIYISDWRPRLCVALQGNKYPQMKTNILLHLISCNKMLGDQPVPKFKQQIWSDW